MSAAFGANAESLITDQGVPPTQVGEPPASSWTADRLRASLLGSDHDIIYLAGHFSANNLLAADYSTTMNANEVAASSLDFSNALVVSAGCHSGYTVVDGHAVPNVTQSLDWIQAFARKRATVVAGTGYQYGDTDFLEYSERLYRDFANALRVGTGPVGVGGTLVSAKQQYLAETATLGGIHQKALLEATLYGLPMSAVNLPAGRIPAPSDASSIAPVGFGSDPGLTLGLSAADLTRDWRGATLQPESEDRRRCRRGHRHHRDLVPRPERRPHQPWCPRRAARHRRCRRPRQGAAWRRLPRGHVHRPRRHHATDRRRRRPS